MKLDNVLPIDAESARILDRRERRFRWFVGIATAAWLAALIPTLIVSPLPPLGMFAALAVLMVLAEHRFVLYGDETAMSGSIVIVAAAGFAFPTGAAVGGVMLIAAFGGLHWAHMRERQVSLILANTAALSLAAGLAAAASSIATFDVHSSGLLVAVGFTCTYWCANSVFIGVATAIRTESSLAAAIRDQLTSDTPVVLLAVGSAMFARSIGSNAVLELAATLAAVLFIVDVVHLGRDQTRRGWEAMICAAVLIGACVSMSESTGGSASAGLVLVGAYLVVMTGPESVRRWPLVTLGAAIAGSAALPGSAFSPTIAFALAMTGSYLVLATCWLLSRADRSRALGWIAIVGISAISRREALSIVLTAASIQLIVWLHTPPYLATVLLGLTYATQSTRPDPSRGAKARAAPFRHRESEGTASP